MNNNTDLGAWWASLALVNAGLAQTKGRSRWYWFLFSLVLGPVATFLIVVWEPRTETKRPAGTRTKTPAATED
jgi:bacteriorhodopsin